MAVKGDILFGKYEVEASLGQGSFGAVYRVKESKTGAILALKLLNASPTESDFTEASVLRSLTHPNIVLFYNYEEDDHNLAFVMEYMDGGSLADHLDDTGPVSPERAISFMVPICKGMKFAHSRNVIHRDLKPENILLNTNGAVKVADFGVARTMENSSAAKSRTGTSYYMAPEVFREAGYGLAADVYSLGCVLFDLLSGNPPFTGSAEQVMYGHLEKKPLIPDVWPEPVRHLLADCLAKEPSERPKDASALLIRIEELARVFEDPDVTHVVKKSATEYAKKKEKDAGPPKAADHSAGRSSDDQAQTLVKEAEAFMEQGDFTKARKYLKLAKEAENDYITYAKRTDRLDILEKAWPHKQEAEKALSSGDLTKAQSALENVKELAGEDDIWLDQFQKKLSEVLEKQRLDNEVKARQEREEREIREAEIKEKLRQGKDEREIREAEIKKKLRQGKDERERREAEEQARRAVEERKKRLMWRKVKWILSILALCSLIFLYFYFRFRTETPAKEEVAAHQDAAVPGSGPTADMVPIPGGSFLMGCVPGDSECSDDEKPQHRVTVDSFYMDTHEVTQAQYEKVMGVNPSRFKDCGSNCPVETVSWNDAKAYCKKVGQRLPTEAEWEYAARGGKDGEKWYGDVDSIAWYSSNSGHKTHPVGRKQANGYGLYDMTGNVWEWCSDWYGKDYYSSSPANNPAGPSSRSARVLRGGSWYGETRILRTSYRAGFTPTGSLNFYGFRCVRDK